MSVKEDYETFSDIWKFYRKYREIKDDRNYWQQLINKADMIYHKYNTQICKSLLLDVLDEFERVYQNKKSP